VVVCVVCVRERERESVCVCVCCAGTRLRLYPPERGACRGLHTEVKLCHWEELRSVKMGPISAPSRLLPSLSSALFSLVLPLPFLFPQLFSLSPSLSLSLSPSLSLPPLYLSLSVCL